MLNTLIIKLCEMLMAFCEKRGRVLKITGSEENKEDVYLIRYYLIRSRWCNVFLHQFLRSDRDDLHDHPWDFFTYLVRGSYTEYKWDEEKQTITKTKRANYMYDDYMQKVPLRKNTLVFRKATDQHMVMVDKDLKESEKDKAALTFFVSGPTKREWGFWESQNMPSGGTIRTWVPWRKYLNLPDDEPGRG